MTDYTSYVKINTPEGEANIYRDSIPLIAKRDAIVFDVDGVLIDVGKSIHLVHGKAAQHYFAKLGWENCGNLVTPEEVDAFKMAGGFNNDWDLAVAWLLLYLFKSEFHNSTDGDSLRKLPPSIEEFTYRIAAYGGGLNQAVDIIKEAGKKEDWAAIQKHWNREAIERLFQEVYSGDLCREVYGYEPETVVGPGMIRMDKPFLHRQFLPVGMKFGIATGRTGGEARIGMKLMGWNDIFSTDVIVSEDDGFLKPDPRILTLAIERLSSERPMYIGDTPDDLLTAKHYAENYGELLVCMVLSGLKTLGLKDYYIKQHADIVADNVNAALLAVKECMGGALCPNE